MEWSVSPLTSVAIVRGHCLCEGLLQCPLDLDLSIVIILLQRVIVAVVEHFDGVLVRLTFVAVGDSINFQVVSHLPQKKL